ncbi:activator of Hsp90 ATPase [Cokeromyces recurvatus]|uniref:activator of Hsp90 ATPase n=1 Tax=Cokeromyces recurvatus TaxID=90255 RepID=UPI0022211C54|nr:activator of Hsp90 ATPase [Cokeromyces recurvatus]KAI7908239.1 activator of Hsp90 ATPase [Cokeromyces recurvatus]
MTDMRNVNNWHWVNKDCRTWAKNYLQQQLVGLKAEKDEIKVSIISLDDCTGDVDLNQRKGRLIAIYDVALKLSWQGLLKDKTKVYGQIHVPEVAYDTEFDDYVFNISFNDLNQSEKDKDELKKLIKTDLIPQLRNKFVHFTQDLINTHSSDLYADKNSAPSTPTLVQRKKTSSLTATTTTNKEDKVIKTAIINHSYEFKGVSARDIYETLLDSKRADIWSHNKSKISKKMGSEFQLFDGNVHGLLLQATPAKSILQTWRLKGWPKDHYSTVTISFTERPDGVLVNVNQVGVPAGQEEIIKRNWMGYYWTPIKDCYNRDQFRDIPYQKDPLFGFINRNYIILMIAILFIIAFTAYQVAPHFRV